MERFGGGLDVPEEHAHLGTIDVVSGWSGAFATCLSIFKRLRTGQVEMASTSLAANAQLIQTPHMLEILPASPCRIPTSHKDYQQEACARGPDAKGDNALYQFYSTKDSQHVFIAGPFDACKRDEAAKKLAANLGLDAELLPPPPPAQWTNTDSNTRWSEAIGAALAKLDANAVMGIASSSGIASCRLTSMADIRSANIMDDGSPGKSGEYIRVGKQRCKQLQLLP